MRHPIDPVRHAWLRRFVLGTAVVLGLVAALPRSTPTVDAAPVIVVQATPKAEPSTARAQGARTASCRGVPALPAAPDAADEPEAATPGGEASSEVTIDHRGVTVQKGGKRIKVHGFGTDREYDSFQVRRRRPVARGPHLPHRAAAVPHAAADRRAASSGTRSARRACRTRRC